MENENPHSQPSFGTDGIADATRAPDLRKARLLSLISHDLRTPLAAIGLAAQILDSTPCTPQQKQCARILKSSARDLLELVDVILDCSALEAGEAALAARNFELGALIRNAVKRHEPEALEKKLSLQTDIDSALPIHLLGDPVKIGQVLTNLIGSAIKRTEKGAVNVAVRAAERFPDGIDIEFRVKDTSDGSAPLIASYEALSNGSRELNLKHSSAELSLAISRKWLQLYGSDMKVASSLGEGCTVSFTLRLQQAKSQT